MINDFEICLICNEPGSHYDYLLRAFTCQLVDGKKVVLYDENGNEKA
jgi:hypothetical protein